jgi:hypothetical protein
MSDWQAATALVHLPINMQVIESYKKAEIR